MFYFHGSVWCFLSQDNKKLFNAGKKGRQERRAVGIVEIQFEEFQPPDMEVMAQHFPCLF